MEKSYLRGSGTSRRKLTLDDHGLRYEAGTGSYSLAWAGFDHRIERTDRNENARAVILMTKDHKWFAVAAFDDMDGIVTAVRQHVPNSGPQSLSEKIFFHPWFNPICFAFGLLGIWLIDRASPVFGLAENQQMLIGWLLLAPTLVVTIYLLPRNPLFMLVITGNPGGVWKRFLTALTIWVAVVFAVVLIVYFKQHNH